MVSLINYVMAVSIVNATDYLSIVAYYLIYYYYYMNYEWLTKNMMTGLNTKVKQSTSTTVYTEWLTTVYPNQIIINNWIGNTN